MPAAKKRKTTTRAKTAGRSNGAGNRTTGTPSMGWNKRELAQATARLKKEIAAYVNTAITNFHADMTGAAGTLAVTTGSTATRRQPRAATG